MNKVLIGVALLLMAGLGLMAADVIALAQSAEGVAGARARAVYEARNSR